MRTQDDITDEVIKRPRSKTGWIDCSRWYEWGDQLTAAFVKLDDDLPIEIKSGCGSNTPYLDKDGNPRFPSEDISDFEKSCNALDKYLEQDHGDWIRASYDRQQNPLPGLRKRVGGTWFFQRFDEQWVDFGQPYGVLRIVNVGIVYWIPKETN